MKYILTYLHKNFYRTEKLWLWNFVYHKGGEEVGSTYSLIINPLIPKPFPYFRRCSGRIYTLFVWQTSNTFSQINFEQKCPTSLMKVDWYSLQGCFFVNLIPSPSLSLPSPSGENAILAQNRVVVLDNLFIFLHLNFGHYSFQPPADTLLYS